MPDEGPPSPTIITSLFWNSFLGRGPWRLGYIFGLGVDLPALHRPVWYWCCRRSCRRKNLRFTRRKRLGARIFGGIGLGASDGKHTLP